MICQVCFQNVIRKHLLDYLTDVTTCESCQSLEKKPKHFEKIPFYHTLLEIASFHDVSKNQREAYTLYHALNQLFMPLDLEKNEEVLVLMLSLHLEDTFYVSHYLRLEHVQKIIDLERYSLGVLA
jgi:hypothetical protein